MTEATLLLEPAELPSNLRGPAAARVRRPPPHWTHTLAVRCFLIAVFLVPVQLEVEAFKQIIDSRLPPGDFFMVLSLLLAPASFRITRQAVGYLPFALMATLAYGAFIAVVLEGQLSQHALLVKFLGALVLAVMGIMTVAYARMGYAAQILRALLLGVVIAAVIAYIDWKIFNILPWLNEDVKSRFGSLQWDPNNAGALFAISLMICWRYGKHLFLTKRMWLTMTALLALGLGLSLSRGAFIGSAAAILVVVIIDHVSAERWMRYLGGGVVLAVALFALGVVDGAINDFQRRPDNVGDRNSLVAESIDMWAETGGLGIGLGTFRVEIDQVVHNTFVWLVTEMSLPGLLLFFGMVGFPLHACLRLRAYDRDLAMALLAAHIVMVVASVGIEALYQRYWWVIIGCTVWPAGSIRRQQAAAVMATPAPDPGG